MATTKPEDFIAELKEITRKGTVKWTETADEDTFRLVFDYAMVKIESGFNSDAEETFYHLTVLNPKGRIVDEIFSTEPVLYTLLSDLFVLARRSAREADSIMDKLRSDIRSRLGPQSI